MKLFLAHCGYYPSDMTEGLFECHTNFFIAAASAQEARAKVICLERFQSHRMHLDSLLELSIADGHEIILKPIVSSNQSESNKKYGFRELRAMAEIQSS